MKQKVAVITGANSGVGFETAVGMAALGYVVVMACRSQDRAEAARQRISLCVPEARLDIILLDLNSLSSVRDFAVTFRKKYKHLDILINNAAILRYNGERTEDGFEAQFGVNYLGHFYLTALLIDIIPDSIESRIVSVSSVAHKSAVIDLADLNDRNCLKMGEGYNQSKLACLMFSDELQRRLDGAGKKILSVCAHPGGTETGIFDEMHGLRRFLLKYIFAPFVGHSNESAARSVLYAALEKDVKGGEYIGPQGVLDLKGLPGRANRTEYSKDPVIAGRLWKKSEELLDYEFSI